MSMKKVACPACGGTAYEHSGKDGIRRRTCQRPDCRSADGRLDEYDKRNPDPDPTNGDDPLMDLHSEIHDGD